jgi:hypothetical protein
MKLFRSARWLLLAVLLSAFSATSYAGVFISVGFAPPELPVYEQPPCPEPGLMWMPGYWAYGSDGYYWVPGAWVSAPYDGALWTPGYWGWSNGLYVFHDGYWGDHVGYYGGVNYGYGYGGIGFVGGMWRGHDFEYNRAVMRLGSGRFNTYEDRTIVNRYTIVNDRRVAFSGGPGGIRHDPGPEERMADRDRHIGRTSIQQQHELGARSDRSSYFNNNHGRPQSPAVSTPLGGGMRSTPGMQQQGRPGNQNQPGTQQQGRPNFQNQQQVQQQQQSRPQQQQQQQQRPNFQNQQQVQPQQQQRPGYQNQTQPGYQNQQQGRPGNQNQPQGSQTRPGYQNQAQPQQQQRMQQQAQPQLQQRPQQQQQAQPQARPQQQSRPAAQQHAAPKEEKPKEK